MPQAPQYDVRVAPGNAPQLSYGQVSNQYAGIGQGIEQVGQAVNKYHDEMAQTQAMDAVNGRDAELRRLKAEFQNEKGLNAVTKYSDYATKMEEIKSKYAGQVSGNPLAQRYYQRSELTAFSDANLFMDEHQSMQIYAHQKDSNTTALANANMRAIDNFNNTGSVDGKPSLQLQSIQEANEVIAEQGKLDGKDAKTIALEQKANESSIHRDVISNLINKGDPVSLRAAKDYLYRNKVYIDPRLQGTLSGQVDAANMHLDALDQIDKFNQAVPYEIEKSLNDGDPAKMYDYMHRSLMSIGDPKMKQAVEAAWQKQVNETVTQRNLNIASEVNSIAKVINEQHGADAATSARIAALPVAQQESLAALASNGGVVVTNMDSYAKVMQMMQNAKNPAELSVALGVQSSMAHELDARANAALVHQYETMSKKFGKDYKPKTDDAVWEQAKLILKDTGSANWITERPSEAQIRGRASVELAFRREYETEAQKVSAEQRPWVEEDTRRILARVTSSKEVSASKIYNGESTETVSGAELSNANYSVGSIGASWRNADFANWGSAAVTSPEYATLKANLLGIADRGTDRTVQVYTALQNIMNRAKIDTIRANLEQASPDGNVSNRQLVMEALKQYEESRSAKAMEQNAQEQNRSGMILDMALH